MGTHRERSGGVSRRRPAPSAVEAEPFILDDRQHTAAAEGLGVGLALDLEDVEREQDDLANADQAAGGRVHDGLARLLAKGILELVAVVRAQVVARHRLAAVLVYPLQHLVAGGIPETGEQRDELPPERRRGRVLEDDGVELRSPGDLYSRAIASQPAAFPSSPGGGGGVGVAHLGLIAHQPLRNGIDLSRSPVSPTSHRSPTAA